ncbi:hypothetical protein L2E82_27975 [Cichorium intybus]|uniref:Uncharacterized protein n=1 Tax=Cichorium intybus TaxID=13427 RepID=A0ACB9CUJ8_CICIN|nr:hypothetical protein L2E82_27975 [Cichorium intybus]
MILNLPSNPLLNAGFYEELGKYGEIESLNICDNLADHMVGNVYAQLREEEHVAAALQNFSGRFYPCIDINFDSDFITMISFKKLIIHLYLQVAPLSLISQQLRISVKQHIDSMKKTYFAYDGVVFMAWGKKEEI